jgi:5-methylcytosine-specific restriction endonuclease McrA
VSPKPKYLQGVKGRKFRISLVVRQGGRCFYCRRGFPEVAAATFDHYIPRVLWQRGYPRQNIVAACSPCNRRKGDRLPLGLVLVLLARRNESVPISPSQMREAA